MDPVTRDEAHLTLSSHQSIIFNKNKICFRSKHDDRLSLTIILTNPIINHITITEEIWQRGEKWIFVFPASLFASLNSPFQPEGQPRHRPDQSHPFWASFQLQPTNHKGHGIVAIISWIITWIFVFPNAINFHFTECRIRKPSLSEVPGPHISPMLMISLSLSQVTLSHCLPRAPLLTLGQGLANIS